MLSGGEESTPEKSKIHYKSDEGLQLYISCVGMFFFQISKSSG
jgi:hypothetical protein